MRAEALARAKARAHRPHLRLPAAVGDRLAADAAAKRVAKGDAHRGVARALVGDAVLDLGAVLVLVAREVQVVVAELVDVAQRLGARRLVVVDEAVEQVRCDAHLLLVELLVRHRLAPARARLHEAAAHWPTGVARQVGEVVDARRALAVELGNRHVVLQPPADERLDRRAGAAEQQRLERAEHRQPHLRVPVAHVRQHRLEQLGRVRLDAPAAVAVGAAHRQQHLLRDDAQQARDALDDLGVVVAAAAERDRAHLLQVRPQQLAALAEHVRDERHERRAHLLGGLLLELLGAEALDDDGHQEGQHAAHLRRRRARLPPPEERHRRLAAPLRRVGEAQQQRLQQRLQLLVGQLELAQPRERALAHADVGVGQRVRLARERAARRRRRGLLLLRRRRVAVQVVVVRVPVGRAQPEQLGVLGAADLRLAGREHAAQRGAAARGGGRRSGGGGGRQSRRRSGRGRRFRSDRGGGGGGGGGLAGSGRGGGGTETQPTELGVHVDRLLGLHLGGRGGRRGVVLLGLHALGHLLAHGALRLLERREEVVGARHGVDIRLGVVLQAVDTASVSCAA